MFKLKVKTDNIRVYSDHSEIYVVYNNNGIKKINIVKVDTEDIEKILEKIVYYNNSGYIQIRLNKGRELLHRYLIDVPKELVVDHINGDRLDNRKSNLRICDRSQNQKNRIMQSNNSSGVSGVSQFKVNGKWMAYISINKKRKHLGYFETMEEAIKARKEAEEKYNGEFNPNGDRKYNRYINGNYMNKKYLKNYINKINGEINKEEDNLIEFSHNKTKIHIRYFRQKYHIEFKELIKNKLLLSFNDINGVRSVKRYIEEFLTKNN